MSACQPLRAGAKALLAFGALFMVESHAFDGQPSTTIELAPGISETLEFDRDVGSAFVADAQIADVEVLNNRTIFVLGVSPGITDLEVHDTQGTSIGTFDLRVNTQPNDARDVVSHYLGENAGITVEPFGNALFVSGTAKSPAQAERLLRGIRAVAGETPVVDAIALDGPAQVNLEVIISEVSRNVTNALGIDWSVDINPFEHPLRTWVTGTGIRMGTGSNRVGEVLEQNISWLPLPRNLNPADLDRLLGGAGDDAQFNVETRELGVLGPIDPRGGDGGIVLAHSKEVNSGKYRATVFLEALAQNGLAVVHARPNLTAVSGQPAEFFSGLEIPVPTITDRGTIGTEYRETGVSLSFTPTVLDSNQISLVVQPRIREIAPGGASIAGTLVPNINERSASTTVELGDGESIAIAGLYRRSSTHSETGIPLLKDIPLWGALFRNSSDRENSVELIIVVTPRIVSAAPAVGELTRLGQDAGSSALQLANEFYY